TTFHFWMNPPFSLANKNEENCDLRQANSNKSAECNFKEHDHRLVCFHGLEDKWKTGGEKVRTLVICYWPMTTFDPQDVLQGFSTLEKLTIKNGNLTRLTSPFLNEFRSIEKLEVTGTKLKELPGNVFVNLSNLKILDFRNNSFSEIDVETFNIASLHHWILNRGKDSLGHKIADKEHLRCTVPYDGRALIPVVEIINTLIEECTKTVCECELVYVVGNGGKHIQKQLMAFASVNCSHRGLTEMPSFLPANTTTLYLTGNKIKDLRPLTTNPVYRRVEDLYLDDNIIESIVQLEGSSWMDRFRLLSLRGNKLTDLPTYALQNVLQHNGNAVSLYLGRNPWRCDCLFTPGFQVRDLRRTEICVSPDENSVIHPLDILNIILAILIFLIIGKLLYDYWSFKKTGKLPWIVAKIP
ncbi:unnamed protein product, partial [Heterotrigona itama]